MATEPVRPQMSKWSRSGYVTENERLKCHAPDCDRHRQWVSAYCHKHNNIMKKYGKFGVKPLQLHHIDTELAELEELFNYNRDNHPGLKRAFSFFRNHMKLAGEGSAVPSARIFAFLYGGRADPERLMLKATAVHALYNKESHLIPNVRSRDYFTGNHVLRGNCPGITKIKTPTSAQIRKLGEYINQELGLLILVLCNGVKKVADNKQRIKDEWTAPLSLA